MVQIILLLVVLAMLASMRRKKPAAADVGWVLPALRMSTALLLVALIGWAVVGLMP